MDGPLESESLSAASVSAIKKKLSIRLLKHKSVSVFTVSAQSKFPRGLQIKGIEFVKYIIMKLRPSRTPCFTTMYEWVRYA